MIATANIDHIVRLREDEAFSEAYRHAWAITADGWPVATYARLFGDYRQGRVTGADLFPSIVAKLSPVRHRIFCLVSNEQTADRLLERFSRAGIPRASVELCVPSYGFEKDDSYSAALAARIRDFGTTHLFMGVGAPKSEVWVNVHRARLGNLYACCFGAALDFYAGTRQRAPRLLQAAGMEWAFRLLAEPRRLATRYLSGGPRYLLIVAYDMLHGGERHNRMAGDIRIPLLRTATAPLRSA